MDGEKKAERIPAIGEAFKATFDGGIVECRLSTLGVQIKQDKAHPRYPWSEWSDIVVRFNAENGPAEDRAESVRLLRYVEHHRGPVPEETDRRVLAAGIRDFVADDDPAVRA